MSEIEVKKNSLKCKIELAKNAQYDSAWCADYEKLYLSQLKNQFLTYKFFVRNLGEKNFFKLENRIG